MEAVRFSVLLPCNPIAVGVEESGFQQWIVVADRGSYRGAGYGRGGGPGRRRR